MILFLFSLGSTSSLKIVVGVRVCVSVCVSDVDNVPMKNEGAPKSDGPEKVIVSGRSSYQVCIPVPKLIKI